MRSKYVIWVVERHQTIQLLKDFDNFQAAR